jgi:hypothetical protein
VEFGKEVTGQDAPTKLQLSSKGKPSKVYFPVFRFYSSLAGIVI